MAGTATLYQRLRDDLSRALADRDRLAVAVLRTLVAAIDNAGAVEPGAPLGVSGRSADVPRRELSEADMLRLVTDEAVELEHAIAEYESRGRPDAAEPLRARLAVVDRYRGPA